MPKLKRILGSYSHGLPGPLLICVAGMHGNEWAGVKALDLVMKMLEVEPISNPGFEFRGKLVCMLGNIPALKNNVRFLKKDLNRLWTSPHLEQHSAPESQFSDFLEMLRLKKAIDQEIRKWKGSDIYLIDLHTTTATGGIFSLPATNNSSRLVAETMLAPVIMGLVDQVEGTLLSYYTDENRDDRIAGIVFEGGQHNDPLSVNRCIAAVINCLRTIGCVDPRHIVNQHDAVLKDYSTGLPKVARLLYKHRLTPGDGFIMRPGFQNFHQIRQGDVLARDHKGEIRARANGMILMPHYQKQGEDGFFVIEELPI